MTDAPRPPGPAFTELVDLASERLGGAAIACNDDFFAPKENLVRARPAIFIDGKYTDRGKWMDGWESRRRRALPGHDWCIVRLGLPGVVRGVEIDTSFFRGNFPESASIEGCWAPGHPDEATLTGATGWFELLPRAALRGDSRNHFDVSAEVAVTHVRLNIFPDGGVARLRVHGEVVPDWRRVLRRGGPLDLAAVELGGRAVATSDMFFGSRHNLLMPGRAADMSDGWETKRRRGPGFDWVIVALGARGTIDHVEVDTAHFKGNFPDACSLEVCDAPGASVAELQAREWQELLPRTKLLAHTRHHYEEALAACGPVTHARFNIYPDGGVSRLRLHGAVDEQGKRAALLRRLDTLLPAAAEAELRACCGSSAWARAMASSRPFGTLDRLLARADAVWAALGPDDWHEAFRAHPKIGERAAPSSASAQWSAQEQAGVQGAAAATLTKLATANRDYEQRFGHIFLICATGRSAEEMLAACRDRLRNDPEKELRVAAEEQRKITRLRLEKLVGP
jgi:allantoicase